MGWTVSKNFDRKLVDEVTVRFDIKGAVQMGDGSSPGLDTGVQTSGCVDICLC